MFEAFASICALVICYLTYEVYKEHMNENAKRMVLIESIEQLRKISQSRKPRKTKKRRLKSIN
jgi:amino acid permease